MPNQELERLIQITFHLGCYLTIQAKQYHSLFYESLATSILWMLDFKYHKQSLNATH